MKKFYIQSISVFSIIIPLIIIIIAWVAITVVKSTMLGDFEKNKVTYQTDQSLNQQLNILKKQAGYAQYVPQWEELMQGDSFAKMNGQLEKSIESANKSKTLTLTSQKREGRPNLGVAGPYSAYSYGIQGTYAEVQQCLLDLESNMPNSMLTKLTINASNSGNFYNFNLNFTTWELTK
ncbi:hypothetical protein [Rubritalea sp.]|uniref:hypothetical protein n=1 Tax=Rubritalea sp. TaxID=2109375 RepID=UPI003EFAB688